MQSLNQLVAAGKVLYLGISDAPAWVVSKANEYARNHGLRQFSVYQGKWSAASRDFERDIIPMAKDEGVSRESLSTLMKVSKTAPVLTNWYLRWHSRLGAPLDQATSRQRSKGRTLTVAVPDPPQKLI